MSTYNFNLVKELLEELIEQICNQVERPASPNITVAPRIELPLDLDVKVQCQLTATLLGCTLLINLPIQYSCQFQLLTVHVLSGGHYLLLADISIQVLNRISV